MVSFAFPIKLNPNYRLKQAFNLLSLCDVVLVVRNLGANSLISQFRSLFTGALKLPQGDTFGTPV